MIDDTRIKATGLVIDRLYDKEGNLIKEIRGHNQVMNGFIAMLTDIARGVLPPITQFSENNLVFNMVIGTGEESWDTSIPAPSPTEKKLVTPILNRCIENNSVFRDSDLVPSANYGYKNFNFRASFDYNEAIGKSLREFGIVLCHVNGNPLDECINGVGDNDSTSYLLEMYRHPVIEKTQDIMVIRDLTISLHF